MVLFFPSLIYCTPVTFFVFLSIRIFVTWKEEYHVLTLTYLLTYSMEQSPSWEANLQLVKKFPAFYWIRKFITILTNAGHLSLSWANSIQSPQPPPTSWRSILILSSHLRLGLPNGTFQLLGHKIHIWSFGTVIFIFWCTGLWHSDDIGLYPSRLSVITQKTIGRRRPDHNMCGRD
jgi:hypothetical protein